MIFVELAVFAAVVFGFYRLRQWLGRFREENTRMAVQHSDDLKLVRARVKDLQWQVDLWEQRMARWDDPRRLIWPEPVHLDRRLETLADVAARPMAAATEELQLFLRSIQPPDAASGPISPSTGSGWRSPSPKCRRGATERSNWVPTA